MERASRVFLLASDGVLKSRSDVLPADEEDEPPGPIHTTAATDEATTPGAVDPRGLGTLVHAVLAEIDFTQTGDVAAIVRRLADQHVDPHGSDAELALALVTRFLGSPRAQALAAAQADHAELEFLLAWPPGDPSGAMPGLQLRGFIDRLYRDAQGEWHILDFKTQRVEAGGLAAVARDYELQMLVYALAAQQVLGLAPRSLTLCILRSGEEIHFDWDEKARRRVVKLVNDAMSRLRGE